MLSFLSSLFIVATTAFVPITNYHQSKIFIDKSSSSSTLYNGGSGGMDSYDAQMRALVSGFQQSQSQQQQPPATNNNNSDSKDSMRWRKRTKQLATLGPASSSFEMIEKLFLAGADVFRLNFSHGEHAEKKQLLDVIRSIEKKYDHPIAVLGDLQGPKLRVGQFLNGNDGESLQTGQRFRFDLDTAPGTNQRVQLPHPEILTASEVGHVLLVDDGKVKLEVTGKGPGYIDCVVVIPGKIKDRKGVNTPDSVLNISPLTPKDRVDLEYMLSIGVDWVALSFVQRPEDIVEIQHLIDQYYYTSPPGSENIRPHVMAKIEKPSCFDDDKLQQIVELCDGIMVARGDLGVECAPEDVPILQKQIIDECREQGKPVVVATQMLESMIDTPTPTRAEASDVATAIYDGADAIMLSAESAAGDYPEESVLMQQRIINRVENDKHYYQYMSTFEPKHDKSAAAAIVLAARQIARNVEAKAIVCFTTSGTTAQRTSKKRPDVPILAISPCIGTGRRLSLSWGIYPEISTNFDQDNFRDMLRHACTIAMKKGLVADKNDLLVVTAGFPFGTPGAANVIRVIPAAGPTHWDASL